MSEDKNDYEIVMQLFAKIGRNMTIERRKLSNDESYNCELCDKIMYYECVQVFYNGHYQCAAHLRCVHDDIKERAEAVKETGYIDKLFTNEDEQSGD